MLWAQSVKAQRGFANAAFSFAGLIALSAGVENTPASAIRMQPSLYWDGNDGPWSSFIMQVGTPPQNVRLLPSTSGNALWVVGAPEGCVEGDPTNCADLRGFEFTPNMSSTWNYIGLYELGLVEERLLGYSGNARFGYDTVTLGWQGSGLPTLDNQSVQAFETKQFYIGSLGISPYAVNLTDINNPHPSLLGALKEEKKVPSRSWAYTAGAHYRVPPVFGSLTLGGFDTTRSVPKSISCPFGADPSRELLIAIHSITSDTTSSPLLNTPIYAFIDSLVPHIWLPIEVCQAFEKAFNLTWDSTSNLYLVPDELHNKLLELNANVTFKLASNLTGGETTDITFPYGSFDLTAGAPYVNGSSRYFPIKRAQNATQYTLGRTFLQQAYVIADYDRTNFSVAQAVFPSSSVAPNLVPILAPGRDITPAGSSGLSTGAIVGIAIGAAASVILMVSIVGVLVWRRRRQRRMAEAKTKLVSAAGVGNVDVLYRKAELDTVEQTRHELDTTKEKHYNEVVELDAPIVKHEAPDQIRQEIQELPAETFKFRSLIATRAPGCPVVDRASRRSHQVSNDFRGSNSQMLSF